MLGLSAKADDAFVAMSALVKSVPPELGAAGGVYLHVKDGALLKLERCWTKKGAVVRFSASAGGKDYGRKEIPWKTFAARLCLVRRKDRFEGWAQAKGRPRVLVASLNWPRLANARAAGALATYKPPGPAPDKPFVIDTPGWTYFQMGRYDKARREPERAPRLLLAAGKDQAKALDAYKKAFDNARRFKKEADSKRIGKKIQKRFD